MNVGYQVWVQLAQVAGHTFVRYVQIAGEEQIPFAGVAAEQSGPQEDDSPGALMVGRCRVDLESLPKEGWVEGIGLQHFPLEVGQAGGDEGQLGLGFLVGFGVTSDNCIGFPLVYGLHQAMAEDSVPVLRRPHIPRWRLGSVDDAHEGQVAPVDGDGHRERDVGKIRRLQEVLQGGLSALLREAVCQLAEPELQLVNDEQRGGLGGKGSPLLPGGIAAHLLVQPRLAGPLEEEFPKRLRLLGDQLHQGCFGVREAGADFPPLQPSPRLFSC